MRRRISRAFGSGFAGVFRTIKAVRPGRPIHPEGVRLTGTLERHGASSGAEWIDTAGTDPVTARLSRSLGLPGRCPDVLGLALRFTNDGTPSDVLLASTGASRAGRFALTLRRNAAAGVFSSLMPYKTASGPLLLAARTVSAPGPLLAEPQTFRSDLGQNAWVLGLYYARPTGHWVGFGTLTLGAGGAPDTSERFDPVLNTLPGTGTYDWAARLREPSYTAARQPARR
ncbi:hypothetical protein [Arthrobacter sp. NPDC058192]|uniref:hypothetical protein n=1 Tax=Arthrobacter sp. NPDC058192 TaxID=3346372 RepID=UPI0036E00AFA